MTPTYTADFVSSSESKLDRISFVDTAEEQNTVMDESGPAGPSMTDLMQMMQQINNSSQQLTTHLNDQAALISSLQSQQSQPQADTPQTTPTLNVPPGTPEGGTPNLNLTNAENASQY